MARPLEYLLSLIGLVDDIGLGQGQIQRIRPCELTLSDGLNVVNRSVGRHNCDLQSWVGVAYDPSGGLADREIDSRETAGPDPKSPSLHQVLPHNDPAQGEDDDQESSHNLNTLPDCRLGSRASRLRLNTADLRFQNRLEAERSRVSRVP